MVFTLLGGQNQEKKPPIFWNMVIGTVNSYLIFKLFRHIVNFTALFAQKPCKMRLWFWLFFDTCLKKINNYEADQFRESFPLTPRLLVSWMLPALLLSGRARLRPSIAVFLLIMAKAMVVMFIPLSLNSDWREKTIKKIIMQYSNCH